MANGLYPYLEKKMMILCQTSRQVKMCLIYKILGAISKYFFDKPMLTKCLLEPAKEGMCVPSRVMSMLPNWLRWCRSVFSTVKFSIPCKQFVWKL